MNITLSGADERTSIEDLKQLIGLGAEIALLLTHSPDGRNRYPRVGWILETVLSLPKACAIHICGSRARRFLLDGDYDQLLAYVKRFQVNGDVAGMELHQLCNDFPNHTIITQDDRKNLDLFDVEQPNHAILVDASGGRGMSPERWTRPATTKTVGFAGGLSPANLRNELPKIAAVAQEPTWIDLESGLRDEQDWFSMEKALQVMEIFNAWRGAAT